MCKKYYYQQKHKELHVIYEHAKRISLSASVVEKPAVNAAVEIALKNLLEFESKFAKYIK